MRINKDVINECRLVYRKVRVFPSRAVGTVMIGRHMEPGGGCEGAGDAGALGNKSQQSQLLSRPSSRLCHQDLALATPLNPLHFQGLIMGCGVYALLFFPGNVARKRRREVSHLPDRWQGNACVGPLLKALLYCGGGGGICMTMPTQK